jgi:hypothetical protein
VVSVFILLLIMSCATTKETTKESKAENKGALTLIDISGGLPKDGLWRQNISLVDMNGDGFLDIVAPPPRKAGAGAAGENRPYIFLWSQEDSKWREGSFNLTESKNFTYGGIAVGDLRRTGYTDIVFAIHAGPIVILENDKNKGFVERPFPMEKTFYARTVEVADVNGDGWPDIIAFSEGPFVRDYTPAGILVGINKEGKGWDVKILEGSSELSGDSMAIGQFKGDGNKDILIAPLTGIKEQKKPVWVGDGKGNFKTYDGDLVGNEVPMNVRAGDVDGDGKDEIVFRLAAPGAFGKNRLAVFKWTGEGFTEMSKGLEAIDTPLVFDLVDLFGDGKKILVVLSGKAIGLYKYIDQSWVNVGSHELPAVETMGAHDLRAGRNRDGSVFIVYNLGYKSPDLNLGLRAFKVKSDGGKN